MKLHANQADLTEFGILGKRTCTVVFHLEQSAATVSSLNGTFGSVKFNSVMTNQTGIELLFRLTYSIRLHSPK